MVRLALLAVLVAACCAGAPAQGAVVPADLPVPAVTAVQQASAAVAASAGATVTSAVRPAVRQVSAHATTTTGTSGPATDATVGTATDLTQAAAAQSGYTTAAVSLEADRSGELHAGVSPSPPGASARFSRPGRGQTGSSAAHREARAALARLAVTGQAPAPATADRAAAGRGAAGPSAAKQRPASPDPVPFTAGGGAALASAAAFSLGGLALLGVVLCLAGPRLRRRLLIRPAVMRPVAFVSLLERPG